MELVGPLLVFDDAEDSLANLDFARALFSELITIQMQLTFMKYVKTLCLKFSDHRTGIQHAKNLFHSPAYTIYSVVLRVEEESTRVTFRNDEYRFLDAMKLIAEGPMDSSTVLKRLHKEWLVAHPEASN